MKHIFIIILILFIGALNTAAQTSAPPPPPPPPKPLIYSPPDKSELKEFVPADKSFQVTFPGVPRIVKQEITNGIVSNYQVNRQGSNSAVNAVDYNFEVNNPEKVYEFAKANLLKSPKSTVQEEKNIEMDGLAGKEFDVLQDYLFQKVRILIVGKRIYEIKTDVTNYHILTQFYKDKIADFEKESERFFQSFKINKSFESGIAAAAAPSDFVGTSSETGYKNTFFNFSFEFPKGWHRLDEEELNSSAKAATAYFSAKQRNDKAFQESLQSEVLIFAVSQRNESAEKGTNLNIGVIKQPDAGATSEGVVNTTKKLMLLNPNSKVAKDVEKIQINGTEFSTATFQTNLNGQTINQKVLTVVRKGYSISFVMTSKNEQGLSALEKIAQSLTFRSN